MQPDISVVSKSLTVGFVPLSACLVSSRIHKALSGSHLQNLLGHTFSAQPVAARVALGVLSMLTPLLFQQVVHSGELIGKLLRDSGYFSDVRVHGLLIGADFRDPKVEIARINAALLGNNILALLGERSSGSLGARVVFLTLAPYLIITQDEITQSICRLLDVLSHQLR